MRSAFQDRLDALPETYRHARAEHVEALVEEFRAAAALQVIAVGSGGSFVTARLLARLVQRHHRSVARAATPLEFGIDAELARGKHLWLLSAEGANPDILAALDLALAAEPARLTVLCNRADSPLASAAAAAGCHVLAFPTRGQRDGFLATHTLLLSSTLLLRAAAAAVGANDPTSAPIVVDALPVEVWAAMSARRLSPVIGRETLIVVYDPEVAEAAWLVETNMWEAALGNVQIADLRNFAHGRHHWLAKRACTTSLLALTTPSTEAIWTGIEVALPSDISRARCVRRRAFDADRRHLGRHGDHAAGGRRRRYRSGKARSTGLRAGNLQCPGSELGAANPGSARPSAPQAGRPENCRPALGVIGRCPAARTDVQRPNC
jgi:hypothetical protein